MYILEIKISTWTNEIKIYYNNNYIQIKEGNFKF